MEWRNWLWPPHRFEIELVVSIVDRHGRDWVVRVIKLRKEGSRHMASPVSVVVGHTVNMSLVFLDQHGNPMLTTPAPDAPPAWSDSTPATGALTVAADGLTASEKALAAGTDTVSVSLSVGGVAFSAQLAINVSPEAQVLTSVEIAATVS